MSGMIALTLKEKEHEFVPPAPNMTGLWSLAGKHILSSIFMSPFLKGWSSELFLSV